MQLGFPTGLDNAIFRDKGREVLSFSRDKGTIGQAQNLARGRDGPGQSVKVRAGTRAVFSFSNPGVFVVMAKL